MDNKKLFEFMSIIIVIIFAVALYVGVPTQQSDQLEAQAFKTYELRILGDFMGAMQYKFEIQATEFHNVWQGTYYRFTMLNGDQVYYPVDRTIVTVKP